MKCPKCQYLGFETGDRCKNCGYDFSLLVPAEPAVPDPDIRPPDGEATAGSVWNDLLDTALAKAPAGTATPSPSSFSAPTPNDAAAALSAEPALPLFGATDGGDDEPLIKLPSTPRAPLSVRRTPDLQRQRATTRQRRGAGAPPDDDAFSGSALEELWPDDLLKLESPDQVTGQPSGLEDGERIADREPATPLRRTAAAPRANLAAGPARPSGALRRLGAGLLDLAILLSVDTVVVYLTLRMTSLAVHEWRLLPWIPMAAFLLLVKITYFSAFTAVGGQTIGKMTTRIRVVDEHDRAVDPSRAIQRTLAGTLSLLAVGTGFLPALVRADRRALHDLVAHTRVVTLPMA